MAKINLTKVKDILVIALGLVLLLNIFLASGLSSLVKEKVEIVKELAKPAKLELTVIEDKNCKDCFDITSVVDSIKKTGVEITKEERLDFNSAKELIKKYKIEKIPTIIVTGEINKTNFGDFEEKGNALLFIKQTPPYTDAVSGKIKGRVSLIHLKDKNCGKCSDITLIIEGLKQSATKIVDEKVVDIGSSEGKELIKKYKIEQVPTLILSKELSVYTEISGAWGSIGTIENDGSYIVRDISPPYVNTSTNKVVGLVDLIMLTDSGCTGCYDVKLHKPILTKYGIGLNSEKTVDIASDEGKALIKKYSIKSVPTIILSKDADAYPALKQIWQQVGSVEEDGNYVFREVTQMGSYKDLTTGDVVNGNEA